MSCVRHAAGALIGRADQDGSVIRKLAASMRALVEALDELRELPAQPRFGY